MKVVRIGGVPEHFNLPWEMAVDDGSFKKMGLDVQWVDFPGGTGAMAEALEKEDIDVAVMLTEGVVKKIHEGLECKIIQEYIESPLIWGIHTAGGSDLHKIEDLRNKKVAISRFGSGSHLMAYIHAESQNWDTNSLEFVEVGDLDGAVSALSKGEADYFMWEHFTTKPLVDTGTFRRIGDCPTPWPCFVIVARERFMEQEPAAVMNLLKTINKITVGFKSIPGIEVALAKRYQQKKQDISQWLKITRWSQKQLSLLEVQKVQEQLLELGLISDIRANVQFLAKD